MKKMYNRFSFLFLTLFAASVFVFSQNFEKVDSIVNNYQKYNNIEKLSDRISKDFESDLDKARAVYTWMVKNVTYDIEEYGKFDYTYKNFVEKEIKETKFKKKLASRTIKKKKAVCEGYSILFLELMYEMGIKSEVITGFSKTNTNDIGRRYRSDHTWNIVEIDNEKKLIDVTWGANAYEDGLSEEEVYFFFLTTPNHFAEYHYPDNKGYSLLEENISKVEFSKKPFLYEEFFIQDYTLEFENEGIIHKDEESKKLKFKLKTDKFIDNIYFKNNRNYIEADYSLIGKDEYVFQIEINKLIRGTLELIINDELIIGYKIRE